jgi:hypothetical protein
MGSIPDTHLPPAPFTRAAIGSGGSPPLALLALSSGVVLGSGGSAVARYARLGFGCCHGFNTGHAPKTTCSSALTQNNMPVGPNRRDMPVGPNRRPHRRRPRSPSGTHGDDGGGPYASPRGVARDSCRAKCRSMARLQASSAAATSTSTAASPSIAIRTLVPPTAPMRRAETPPPDARVSSVSSCEGAVETMTRDADSPKSVAIVMF